MDPTIIFLIVLMLLAIQNGMYWLAVLLFLVAVITSKNKFFLGATLIGGAVGTVLYLGIGSLAGILVGAGLFIAFLLVILQDSNSPQGSNGYGQQQGY